MKVPMDRVFSVQDRPQGNNNSKIPYLNATNNRRTCLENVGNNVEKNLYHLTADKKWSHDVTWELMSLCSLFFDSLVSSGTWEILYERLTRNQVASLLNNIIKNHLDNDILLDIPKFKCTNCKKISSNVFASDNCCFECKFVIANS